MCSGYIDHVPVCSGESTEELSPVKDVKVADDLSSVEITFADKTVKTVKF